MAVKAFNLSEEPDVVEVLVQDPYRIKGIDGCDQLISSIPNGLQMPGSDKPSNSK